MRRPQWSSLWHGRKVETEVGGRPGLGTAVILADHFRLIIQHLSHGPWQRAVDSLIQVGGFIELDCRTCFAMPQPTHCGGGASAAFRVSPESDHDRPLLVDIPIWKTPQATMNRTRLMISFPGHSITPERTGEQISDRIALHKILTLQTWTRICCESSQALQDWNQRVPRWLHFLCDR